MGVNFPGGPDGEGGKKYSPPVPASGKSQPVPITTTNAPDQTNYPKEKGTAPSYRPKLPTGGNNPIAGGAE